MYPFTLHVILFCIVLTRLAVLGGPTGILRQMAKDKVTPNLKTFTQLLDSLPPNTQAEEVRGQMIRPVREVFSLQCIILKRAFVRFFVILFILLLTEI